jgi:Chalcone isomerase-like
LPCRNPADPSYTARVRSRRNSTASSWPRFRCVHLACALIVALAGGAWAATLDGVPVPETVEADGKTLHLNGFGLRTYSILRFHIYVAALYLEHPSADPNAILNSPGTKLLTVSFLHDVSAERARRSWQDGLKQNYLPPSCTLDANEVATFLAHVPAMRAGERFALLFDAHGAEIEMDDQPFGVIPRPEFAEAMLATFLGPNPGSHRLKRELLTRSALQTSR